MKIVFPGENDTYAAEAIEEFARAKHPVALTGAGVSVESGIDDFRSPGGIWSQFPVDEYGTIEVFQHSPEKAWALFRVLGECLVDRKPNPAHFALAELERMGCLQGVVTQNIDGLHQQAKSSKVFEIHGDGKHLQCIQCGTVSPADSRHLTSNEIPTCSECGHFLKPNVVLFGENVRYLDRIYSLVRDCDLLMVVGTSAQVYPAAGLPERVKQNQGLIFEFNREETVLSRGKTLVGTQSDFLFQGNAGVTLPFFVDHLKKFQPCAD